jgi:hypothetical protein
MKRLKLLSMLFMITISSVAYSQFAVTCYSIYALGVNTSQSKKISAELKTYANRKIEDLGFELDGFWNFRSGEYHRFSAGLGVSVTPFDEADQIKALTVPFELEIFPLKEFKKLSLLFELTPEILPEDGMNLRSLWGIRYSFGGKNDKPDN